MSNFLSDTRHGMRLLVKSPVFTLVAVLSLALGIGANTAIFSLVKAFILAPLPVDKPSELMTLFTTDLKNAGPLPTSDLNFRDYRDKNDVFSSVLAYTFTGLDWSNKGDSKPIFAEVVTGNYFDVLGVHAVQGRTFVPDEDKEPGTSPVVVLSYGLWQRGFGGSDVIGSQMTLNRLQYTVVGVAPKDFTGTDLGGGPDLWVPMMMHDQVQPGFDWYNTRRGLFLSIIGRLKPGVAPEQAGPALGILSKQLEGAYPEDNAGRGIKAVPLLQARIDPDGSGTLLLTSRVLMGVVAIILLIACANIANLLLPRGLARRKEIAIRLAIGASRARLVTQLMTESLMLAVAGGAVGLLMAFWSKSAISSLDLFGGGPNSAVPHLDGEVLAFAAAVTLLSALLFGLAPALQATKPDVVGALKGDAVTTGRRAIRFDLRKALIVAQVALSVVSLAGAGLFIRSLQRAEGVDPGFAANNLLLMNVNLGREGYSEARGRIFYRQAVDKLQAVGGVRSATVARDAPFAGGFSRSVFIEGQEPGVNGRGVLVQTNNIGLRFFDATGLPMLRGRDFNESDGEKAPKAVIINDTMAQRFWPGQDALGKRFKFFGDADYRTVVGISKDSKYNSLVENPRPFVYMPLQQEYVSNATLYVRTVGDPRQTIAAVRSEIQSLDPQLPLLGIRTVGDVIDQSLTGQRTEARLLGLLGGLALLLAAIGLYGVVAYSVAQRTREIGIRVALGAAPKQLIALILSQGMAIVAVGVVLGVGAALVMTRFIDSLLFGVGAADPITFIFTALILTAVALLANLIPAVKASRVDPVVALHL
jgi:predicted permease